MKNFDVPSIFKSPLISAIKNYRKEQDPRKKDFSPTVLDFGAFRILLARHFGFCYGVENAIEIAYNALAKHPQQHIYFLSEMIHNPEVNADLQNNGISFIFDTYGNQLIAWESLPTNAVVLIPAFGTTLEVAQKLKTIGAIVEVYDTTCPFVKKVWNRAESLGKNDFTVIIHGKPTHEETRATFSHSSAFS
ncbi:MAG: 4-hydroxy-3-methylbut-2-enyl diphosphate reductase, partial [Chitinophagales bacterium]|nr:4-hydroxy-3-methylbut-2-enyl diphosphate reductase [Chitinophagales bacterium]